MVCRELFIRHPANAFFAGSRTERLLAKRNTRQSSLCREQGSRQSSAVGKINSLPGVGTRQNMTAGKVDWRDGGHLPSAFAGCHAVRHPANIFFFFK